MSGRGRRRGRYIFGWKEKEGSTYSNDPMELEST